MARRIKTDIWLFSLFVADDEFPPFDFNSVLFCSHSSRPFWLICPIDIAAITHFVKWYENWITEIDRFHYGNCNRGSVRFLWFTDEKKTELGKYGSAPQIYRIIELWFWSPSLRRPIHGNSICDNDNLSRIFFASNWITFEYLLTEKCNVNTRARSLLLSLFGYSIIIKSNALNGEREWLPRRLSAVSHRNRTGK